MRLRTTTTAIAALVLGVGLSACGSSGSPDPGSLSGGGSGSGAGTPVSGDNGASGGGGNGDTTGGGTTTGGTNPAPGGGTPGTGAGNNGADPGASTNPNIDARQINYGEALRTASLKLLGELPSLADINKIGSAAAADQKALYGTMIDAMLADARFAAHQVQWWRDTLKTGGAAGQNGMPSFDTAATFAASVVVGDRPYTDLFTAKTGTCPTFANGTFTAANCAGGAPTAGLLTDPGLMSQYYANMAFRRARFVQETFVCSKYPAEFSAAPKPLGAGTYTSPWDFNSITGGATAKVNFQDTSAVICANCHTTMNHIAPLFANFDAKGVFTAGKIAVLVPSTGTPVATLGDWLPTGAQTLAWRNGQTVTDLPSLGAAIAADPDVARCAVNRVWNLAMSRGDIVNDLATIPPVVTDPLLADFKANGMKLKAVIRSVFTSDDFVKF
jgi:hypothetical protein